MTLPFSTARRLRVSTCKSLQARPMLVAMTSTGRSPSAEADGPILGASLKGTSAMITRRLYAAMSKEGREYRRVGGTAWWGLGRQRARALVGLHRLNLPLEE